MLNGENRMKIKIGWLFVTVLMLTSCGGIRSVRTAKTTAKADGASLMKETLLSAEQQRKYDYFFLEAMRMKGKNEYDAAFGLLQHCLDINPTASSALYEISQYYMFLRQDSIKIFPSKKILSQIKFFCLTSIEIEKLLV